MVNRWNSFTAQRQAFILFSGWTLICLTQAAFSELWHDEAYYVAYARHLAPGYFDHPPAIAVLIRMGMALLPGELGVRLFVVVAHLLSLWCIWSLTDRKQPLLFFGIAGSVSLMLAGSLLAVPDSPFIACIALFLVTYRWFLAKKDGLSAVLLGLVVAGILYSKYHGGMLLLFTIIAWPRNLIRWQFWLAVAVAVTAYFPHLVWMYDHDFPSLRFHFTERDKGPWDPLTPLNYLGTQLLVMGPLVSIPLVMAAWRYRAQDVFTRTLQVSFWGIMGLLGVLSFRQHIEANWAASAYVPLMVMAVSVLADQPGLRRWFWRLAVPSIVLFMTLRLALMVDFLPQMNRLRPETHGWKAWAGRVEAFAGAAPVVFMNSYQLAAKYGYYSGKTSYSLNNISGRPNQYDLWDTEEMLQGKRVLVFSNWDDASQPLWKDPMGDMRYMWVDNFRSYGKVSFEVPRKVRINKGETLRLPVSMHVPPGTTFAENPDMKPILTWSLISQNQILQEERTTLQLPQLLLAPSDTLYLPIAAPPGNYRLQLGIRTGIYPPTRCSRLISLEIAP